MTTTSYAQLVEIIRETFETIAELNATKGLEYGTESGALANLHNGADRAGIDPMQAWAVFFNKHTEAIYAFIRNGKVLSEPIEGRIDDAILYLILLKGLVREQGAADGG